MCKYFKGINNIDVLVDKKGERIFKITVPINPNGESSILVIGRSPKCCELSLNESELNRAIKYLLNNKDELGVIKSISFVFVFPVIEYTKYALQEVLEKEGELFLLGNEGFWSDGEFIKNDLVIFEEMIECNHIVLAWGKSIKPLKSIYESRIQYLLKGFKLVKNNCFDLKKLYVVGGLTNDGYPRNYLSWNKELRLVNYDI